jgi:urea transport system permease protein
VVLAFPDGLAGLYTQRVRPWFLRRRAAMRADAARRRAISAAAVEAAGSAPPSMPAGTGAPGSVPAAGMVGEWRGQAT